MIFIHTLSVIPSLKNLFGIILVYCGPDLVNHFTRLIVIAYINSLIRK